MPAHPSDDVKEIANELVAAVGTSFGATTYLFLSLGTAGSGEGMQVFEQATQRQEDAVALAERLLKTIRDY
jgi:hypothetical protein